VSDTGDRRTGIQVERINRMLAWAEARKEREARRLEREATEGSGRDFYLSYAEGEEEHERHEQARGVE
jgi:hypothetical protein